VTGIDAADACFYLNVIIFIPVEVRAWELPIHFHHFSSLAIGRTFFPRQDQFFSDELAVCDGSECEGKKNAHKSHDGF
jgi:hypothetical protein